MNEKVVKFPKKKKEIIKRLRSNYPKMERDCQFYEIDFYDEEYPENGVGDPFFKATKTLEDEGYIKISDFDILELCPPVLAHMVYRNLKEIYKRPDILSFTTCMSDLSQSYQEGEIIDVEAVLNDEGLLDVEWSYLLKLREGLYIEITRGNKFIPQSTLWANPDDIQTQTCTFEEFEKNVKVFLKLFSDSIKFIEQPYRIEAELEQAKFHFRYVTNLYSVHLKAGDDILELSEELIKKKEEEAKGILHFSHADKIMKTIKQPNILYMSATIFFMMALEGFINILYQFLLKPDFKYDQFKRSISRNPLELKILTLPVYCRGFNKSKITPKDYAIEKWQDIRGFRNNLIHANLTEENEFIMLKDNGISFLYNTLFDFKKAKNIKNHTQPLLFRRDDATEVKITVEGIVADIIEKMDKKEKDWVKSWIEKNFISEID
jgi:hypothetical protein